jgi:hypothetical protein
MRSKGVRKNIDEAFDVAKQGEEVAISKATDDIALKTSPEDVLKQTDQGPRPFINNEYLDTPEDIKNTLNSVSNIFEKTIDKARRGRMSLNQTRELADQLGMSVEDLTKRNGGQAFNAEEALAARSLLNKSGENVTRLAKLAVNPETNTEQIQFAFHKSLARHAAIQEQVTGIAAEAGRALRSFQIPAGVPDRAKALKELLDQSGRQIDPDKLADMVSKLDTPEGIAKFTRAFYDPSLKDQVMEAWINGLLSGPTTQAVNVTSNTLVALWTIPETAVAATLGAFRKSDKVYFREVGARAFGIAQGAKNGIKLAAKTFMTEEPSDLLTKIELNRYRSIPTKTFREGAKKKVFGGVPIPFSGQIDIGGKQVRIPGRALQAGDEFFKSVGYRMELNARAMRSGLDKGLSGKALSKHIKNIVDNPPKDIKLAAIETARYQTFTNELGRMGQGLQNIAAHHAAARVVMPFIRTPVNIVKFAGHRSPLGLAMDSVRAAYKAGGVTKDIARARIFMGSAVGTAVASMALEGHITGNGPSDPAQKSALYATGWQPYSIKIGDKYYSYSRLEPLGMILGISSDFSEIAQYSTEDEADSIGAMVVGSIAKNLTSKTWLRGLSEIILAIEDPDRYGDNYIRKLAGTAIPTGVAQIARIEDPLLRSANTTLEQIQSRIPGVSKDLYPVRNVWGEPISLSGALGPDIISPVYTSIINNDPVATEVARLGVGISRADRKIKGIQLTDEQYDKYVFMSGTIAKRVVMKYVTSPGWKNIPDYMKKDIIKRSVSNARKAARNRISPELVPQFLEKNKEKIKEMRDQK